MKLSSLPLITATVVGVGVVAFTFILLQANAAFLADTGDASIQIPSSTVENASLEKRFLGFGHYLGSALAFNKQLTVASNLALLLQNHDLTTHALTGMFPGTYLPQDPLDSGNEDDKNNNNNDDDDDDHWKAEIVTPIEQGVDGILVQAVLFTNEHRNPVNPQRVLSFAGVQWIELIRNRHENIKVPYSEGSCLEAQYGFKGTQAEAMWQQKCVINGYIISNITEWAAQAGALVESTNATFLTGHKLGCEIAKSEGLLNPNLPVVCWSATGSLTESWIDAYPGLAEAIGRTTKEEEEQQTQIDIENENNDVFIDEDRASTSSSNSTTNTDPTSNNNNNDTNIAAAAAAATVKPLPSYQPENEQIYVLQTFTDPNSNCLLPMEKPGTGLAHVCAYPATSRCDSFNGAPGFDYGMFSKCSEWTSSVSAIESKSLPVVFQTEGCILRETVGTDTGLRDCPYNKVAVSNSTPGGGAASPFDFNVQSTGSYSAATELSLSVVLFQTCISILVTTLFLFR